MAAAKPTADWSAIEVQYRAGQEALRTIAQQYGVTEGAIRARAKKAGWTRDPAKTKRAIVRAAMAGVTHGVTQDVTRNIECAAAQDIEDQNRGLRINRQCLISLETAAETCTEPRYIKVIVEATKAAIDCIRNIRGLNDTDPTSDDDSDDDAILTRLFPELAAERAAEPVQETKH